MRMLVILLAGMLAASSTGAAPAANAGEPRTAVAHFHARLLESAGQEDYSERVALLAPVISETFSISTMSRIALGRNWRSLAPAAKSRVEHAMKQLVVSGYASRFVGGNHRFDIVATDPISSNRVMVRTTLITAEGQLVDLDYQLVEQNDQWLIYDVVANGVSDLSMKRAVYAKEFESGGLESVLASMRATVEKNEP